MYYMGDQRLGLPQAMVDQGVLKLGSFTAHRETVKGLAPLGENSARAYSPGKAVSTSVFAGKQKYQDLK